MINDEAVIEWLESPLGDEWSRIRNVRIESQGHRYIKHFDGSWSPAWATLEPPESDYLSRAFYRHEPERQTFMLYGKSVKIEEDEYVASLSSPA